MGNSVEYIGYNCAFFTYSQLLPGTPESGRLHGQCLSCSFKREETGAEVTFHNSIMGNFMVNKIYLKQIYCSYSRTHNIQNGLLLFLLVCLRSTLLPNRNKHIGE